MRSTLYSLPPVLLLASTLAAQPALTVTLYDVAGLPDRIRQAAKAEAARILLQVGIRVEWVDCEVAGEPVNLSACTLSLGPSRVMFQFIPGRNQKNPRASGMASIQSGFSVFACVYPVRIRELSRDANWEFADLLGHAVAHELGHLLLESPEHSTAGVMRARWETEDLRRLSHNGLTFLPGQLAVAHTRLQAAAPDSGPKN